MKNPTVALTTSITIDGEARTLKYALLAFQDLGLNPYKPSTIAAFTMLEMDLALMARLIRAGLLHEYHGKDAPRRGQNPPTMEDLLSDFDAETFGPVATKVMELLAADAKSDTTGGDGTENPPTA